MTYLERASMLLTLAERLKSAGSWCGETHFQKAVFVLEKLFRVPLGFDFVLYKHGPYSFDLADAINELRADELISVESRYPYGVSISPTGNAQRVLSRAAEPTQEVLPFIEFVARRLGPMGVKDLEKIATAFWVRDECAECSEEEKARRISALKPHISFEESRKAVAEVQAFDKAAQAVLAA